MSQRYSLHVLKIEIENDPMIEHGSNWFADDQETQKISTLS